MSPEPWPYNLPMWRRRHEAASPDGKLVARIDPAWEVSMSNPTQGILCVSCGLHLLRCNPSFVWSDDSRYLAVPRFFNRFGFLRLQRIVVIAFDEQCVYESKMTAAYFQPDSFEAGRLVVSVNPTHSQRKMEFELPRDFARAFRRDVWVPWPETSEKADRG